MRKSTWLALGIVLVLGPATQAQSRGPGFFGFEPNLFGNQQPNEDPDKPPIPIQVRDSGFRLLNFIPKINISFRKPTPAVTPLPDSSQIDAEAYLKAFHYQPPKPVDTSFLGWRRR